MMNNPVKRAIDTNLSSLQVMDRDIAAIMNNVREGKKVKKKISVGLVFLIAFLLIAGMAFAMAHSYVLEYLYGNNSEQTVEQQKSVQAIGLVHTNAGVQTSVKDALFDGKTLSVGLTFETKEQIYIITDAISVDGIPVELDTSSLENCWAGNNPFQSESSRFNVRGFSGNLAETLSSQKSTAEVDIKLTLLTPQSQLHAIDTFNEDQSAMWTEINASVAAGETPVDQDEPYPVLVGSAWFGDGFNIDSPVQYPLNTAEAYKQCANMSIIDEFDLTFTMEIER
jgi:hypothetical protein